MDSWIVWLILAAALGVAELFTLTAAMGIISVAALLTAGVAAIGLPAGLQLLVFVLASGGGLLGLRPLADAPPEAAARPEVRRLGPGGQEPAYVTHEVTGRGGRVKIGGEEWSARAYDETLVIPVGATVDVFEIEGATALVYPRE